MFNASHKYAPIAARKARPVADMVRGLEVNDALEALATTHRRAARLLDKVIRSAVANAEQSQAMGADDLFVARAIVNEGPLKQGRMRWRPGAMGRIKPIHKRSSHIEVTLGIIEGEKRRRPRREAEAAAAEASDEVSED